MTTQEEFWNWFTQHDKELLTFEVDQERLFNQVATELQKVDPDLTFEFGPKEARREFVISAGGMQRAFPVVVSMVNTAPIFERWRVTAFRPRRIPSNVVKFRGRCINPKDVLFSLLDNGMMVGVYLFIQDFDDKDIDLKQIGYLLLDDILGEYDVETRIGLIKMFPLETRTNGDRYSLTELPILFDRLVSHLEGRFGKPL